MFCTWWSSLAAAALMASPLLLEAGDASGLAGGRGRGREAAGADFDGAALGQAGGLGGEPGSRGGKNRAGCYIDLECERAMRHKCAQCCRRPKNGQGCYVCGLGFNGATARTFNRMLASGNPGSIV